MKKKTNAVKYIIYLMLLFIVSLGLVACGNKENKSDLKETQVIEEDKDNEEDNIEEDEVVEKKNKVDREDKLEEQEEKQEDNSNRQEAVTGRWIIDTEMTDSKNTMTMQEQFGSGLSSGCEMKFEQDKTFSFYIGTGYGGKGTYTVEDDEVTADIVTDTEQKKEEIEMSWNKTSGSKVYLVMDLDDYEVYWYRQ